MNASPVSWSGKSASRNSITVDLQLLLNYSSILYGGFYFTYTRIVLPTPAEVCLAAFLKHSTERGRERETYAFLDTRECVRSPLTTRERLDPQAATVPC